MGVPDHIKVANPEIYFPDNKLLVNRFQDDFVAKNGNLLDFFFDYTEKKSRTTMKYGSLRLIYRLNTYTSWSCHLSKFNGQFGNQA